MRCGVMEKLYATTVVVNMRRVYTGDLARLFYNAASGIHMRGVCTPSVILYSLFIKYFKFYIKNFIYICAAYAQTQRGQKLSMVTKLNLKF